MVLLLKLVSPSPLTDTPQHWPFGNPIRDEIMGFVQLTNTLQECTFKVMTKSRVAVKALLRKV